MFWPSSALLRPLETCTFFSDAPDTLHRCSDQFAVAPATASAAPPTPTAAGPTGYLSVVSLWRAPSCCEVRGDALQRWRRVGRRANPREILLSKRDGGGLVQWRFPRLLTSHPCQDQVGKAWRPCEASRVWKCIQPAMQGKCKWMVLRHSKLEGLVCGSTAPKRIAQLMFQHSSVINDGGKEVIYVQELPR